MSKWRASERENKQQTNKKFSKWNKNNITEYEWKEMKRDICKLVQKLIFSGCFRIVKKGGNSSSEKKNTRNNEITTAKKSNLRVNDDWLINFIYSPFINCWLMNHSKIPLRENCYYQCYFRLITFHV